MAVALAIGCGDDDAKAPPATAAAGAGGTAGTAGASSAGTGGTDAAGMGGTDAAGNDGGGAAGSSTAPATLDLSIVKNGVAYPLDRAQFGLTKLPEGHEIYVEAHFGGDPACPTQGSPSPARTAIITGLLAEDPVGKTIDFDSHARANLLDFAGDITTEPILKGVAVTLTSLPSNPCLDCAAGDPARFVAFEVDATLSDGTTIQGTVRAAHCGSLDE